MGGLPPALEATLEDLLARLTGVLAPLLRLEAEAELLAVAEAVYLCVELLLLLLARVGAVAAEEAGEGAREDEREEGVKDLRLRPPPPPPPVCGPSCDDDAEEEEGPLDSAARYFGLTMGVDFFLVPPGVRFLAAADLGVEEGVDCRSASACSSASRALTVLERRRVERPDMVRKDQGSITGIKQSEKETDRNMRGISGAPVRPRK